jgi:hypothetical protein
MPSLTFILFLSATFAISSQHGRAQVSSDWHKRYGQPVAERYALQDGFVLTVSYSSTGRTCKVMMESAKPQSRSTFERSLDEIVPPTERGKKLRSIGLSNRLGSTEYERVTVSLYPASRENQEEIKSAIIYWHGIQCSNRASNKRTTAFGEPNLLVELPNPET